MMLGCNMKVQITLSVINHLSIVVLDLLNLKLFIFDHHFINSYNLTRYEFYIIKVFLIINLEI